MHNCQFNKHYLVAGYGDSHEMALINIYLNTHIYG